MLKENQFYLTFNEFAQKEFMMWLYENVGIGGQKMRLVPGCQGLEDIWDGDVWHLEYDGRSGRYIISFKYDKDALLFKLRWL